MSGSRVYRRTPFRRFERDFFKRPEEENVEKESQEEEELPVRNPDITADMNTRTTVPQMRVNTRGPLTRQGERPGNTTDRPAGRGRRT